MGEPMNQVVRDALQLALSFAEAEYETRGPENDLNYEIKAADVIADVREALDLMTPGAPPSSFSLPPAMDALRGNAEAIAEFVDWVETPQGWEFWDAQYRARKLSSAGRFALEAWVRFHEPNFSASAAAAKDIDQ